MALDAIPWNSPKYRFEQDGETNILKIEDTSGNTFTFNLNIERFTPEDKDGNPTLNQQQIRRGKDLHYDVQVESGVDNIASRLKGPNLDTLVENLAIELAIDIDTFVDTPNELSPKVFTFLANAKKKISELVT